MEIMIIVTCFIICIFTCTACHVIKIISPYINTLTSPFTIGEHFAVLCITKVYKKIMSSIQLSITRDKKLPTPETFVKLLQFKYMLLSLLKTLNGCTMLCTITFCPSIEVDDCMCRLNTLFSCAAKLYMDIYEWNPDNICPVCLENVTSNKFVCYSMKTASVTCNNVFCGSCASTITTNCPISRRSVDLVVELP